MCYQLLVIEIREYIDHRGRSPFADWFDRLDGRVAIRVRLVVERIGAGHLSGIKAVGGGVLEYRMHTGPGYRIYFGRDGDALILLLGGGTKRCQSADIAAAQDRWAAYLRRKREET